MTQVGKFSIEKLLHLSCGYCSGWWTIGDGDPTKSYHCPHCGKIQTFIQAPPMNSNTEKKIFRVIGDVHSEYESYQRLTTGADYSLQVGDLGLNVAPLMKMGIDFNKHKVLGGNHDCYDINSPNYYFHQPYALHHYGTHYVPGLGEVFYIRGAWSVDGELRRKKGRKGNWWPEEQLTPKQFAEARKLYLEVKPNLVVTHAAPAVFEEYLFDEEISNKGILGANQPSATSSFLEALYRERPPKTWVFGHYHVPFKRQTAHTLFVGLKVVATEGTDHESYYDFIY